MAEQLRQIKYPYPGKFTWRQLHLGDAEAILEIHSAMDAADRTNWSGTLEETQQDFYEPGFDPVKDTLAAFTADGVIAALGWVYPPKNTGSDYWLHLWGVVHPNYRRMGLGTFLMGWLEQRGVQMIQAIPDELPGWLRTVSPDYLLDRVNLYQRFGFQLVRSNYRMRRSLTGAIPDPVVPAGLRLVSWQARMDSKIREAVNEAFRDHWGHADWSDFEWETRVINNPNFRSEYSFLVLDGDEVAGACLNRVLDYEIERTGLQEGWIASLGVRRPYRKQGLGTALLCASMKAFQADGFTHAGLGVDTENLTGALRIYERLGFEVIRKDCSFMKKVGKR